MNPTAKVESAVIIAEKIDAKGNRKNLGIVSAWYRNPIKNVLWKLGRFIRNNFLSLALILLSLHLYDFHHGTNILPFVILAIVFTNAGRAILSSRLKGLGTEPNYIAWGTGQGTADPHNTTLFSEAAEGRVQGTSTLQTASTSNDTYQVVGTLTASGNKSITNAGLFDSLVGGNMFVKGDFTPISLLTNEGITFTIRLTFS